MDHEEVSVYAIYFDIRVSGIFWWKSPKKVFRNESVKKTKGRVTGETLVPREEC